MLTKIYLMTNPRSGKFSPVPMHKQFILLHCRPTVWTWRALSLEFARRREGFGGMPIASFFRVVDISFEYRGDAVP